MSTTALNFGIRSARSLTEAKTLWWPLMQELGWNRAEEDCQTHFNVADYGKNWLLLIPESSKKPEGMVMQLIYANRTAWVGFFIMNASFRQQGYGGELWKAMMARFHEAGTATVGLDAVEAQIETYRRRGFQVSNETPYMTRESLDEKPINVTWDQKDDVELQDLSKVGYKLLAKLDLEHTGLDREAYWDPVTGALTWRRHALGYAIVDDSGKLTGFIYARRCQEGVRIGPLYAASYPQARQLLHKLMSDYDLKNGTMVAEIFGSNKDGIRVFEELGFTHAISFHRMWLHGKVPAEQQDGGKGASGMYAIFDACAG